LVAGDEYVEDVAVERHGRILLAGAGFSGGHYDALVVRLLGNGALDPSFNFVGWTNVDVFAEGADDVATAIGTFPGVGPVPDPTWVVGYAEDPDTQPGGGPGTAGFAMKFDAAGAPDLDFGDLPQTGVVRIEYARWDYLLGATFDARGD